MTLGPLIHHPENDDFWHHNPPKPKPCWVCREPTEWIYLDMAYQHPDCDWYPTEDGEVRIVRGVRQ